ncbi:MAG: hypothetical protein KDA96_24615 [Planctomycetaceae bacterium]|nr:hypothetical protein [Planctomycetaceae bacterium]
MYESHTNQDGMWFRNAMNGFGPFNRPKEYFFGARFIQTKTRDLNGIVGAEGVPTYAQQNDPLGNDINPGLMNFHYFNPAPAALIPQLRTNGIAIDGGFWNPDGSGLLVNVTWNARKTSRFDARAIEEAKRLPTLVARQLAGGAGIPNGTAYPGGDVNDQILTTRILSSATNFDTTDSVGFGIYGSTFDILDRTMFNLYSIPVLTGDDLLIWDGESAPYDMDFILEHSIQTLGGSVDWAFAPIYEGNGIVVRPTFGGRYFRIDEQFGFRGRTSLLYYGLDNADADTPITAKVFPPKNGIDEDGDYIADTADEPNNSPLATGTTFSPLPGFSENLIVNAYLNSRVVSDMGGPEVGLHYQIGEARAIQLTGSTKFGVMFNREKLTIDGDNIGNAPGQEVIPDPITGANVAVRLFDTDTTNGPTQNAFADATSSTHVSPMIEQGLTASIPIFSRVPVLRDAWQLEDARLNVGWNLLWIGEVADPNESIIWKSSPVTGVFPEVDPDRFSFTQNTFSIGVDWAY